MILSLAVPTANAVERWWGVSIGADFNNFDPMPVISLETGLWPDNKKFGYQAYLEYGDPPCDGALWTIGSEAVFRYKKVYGGVGLALSNQRLCGLAGTQLNFSTVLGLRINKNWDIQWRHRSHGSDFGISEDSPNDGVNLIELRWHTKWGSDN